MGFLQSVLKLSDFQRVRRERLLHAVADLAAISFSDFFQELLIAIRLQSLRRLAPRPTMCCIWRTNDLKCTLEAFWHSSWAGQLGPNISIWLDYGRTLVIFRILGLTVFREELL